MRMKWKKPTASGRRTGWGKIVEGIDRNAGRGAKAIVGNYLSDGCQIDLPNGTLILEIIPEVSAKSGYQQACLQRVDGDELVEVGDWDWYSEYLDCIDGIESALAAAVPGWEVCPSTDGIWALAQGGETIAWDGRPYSSDRAVPRARFVSRADACAFAAVHGKVV